MHESLQFSTAAVSISNIGFLFDDIPGFYAQSMADYPAAIGHFKTVLACESSHLHPMAAGTAALCELQNDESMAGSSKALEHLQCETLQDGSKSDRALEEILTPSDK